MGTKNIRIRDEDKNVIDMIKKEIAEVQNFPISDHELMRRITSIPNLKTVLKKDAAAKIKFGFPLEFNQKKRGRKNK